MVLKDGTLCILDFELSYAVVFKKPEPPFLLGTFGYVAPEQLKYAQPDYKEDSYSLGALLCFLLTNIPPVQFITNLYKVERELYKITCDRIFSKKTIRCLSSKRYERPSVSSLKKEVLTYLNRL
jgi:serine/threonine protein kinase